jgi:DNA polymerase V
VGAAVAGITKIYQAGYELSKAGVMLLDLMPDHIVQHELDMEDDSTEDRSKLMAAMDKLNNRYGKGTVHMASTGTTATPKAWGMKQERRTPQYTTKWEDLPLARA